MSDTGNDEAEQPAANRTKKLTKRRSKTEAEITKPEDAGADNPNPTGYETYIKKGFPETAKLNKMPSRWVRRRSEIVGEAGRGLGLMPAPTLDVELKKVLLNDSMASIGTQESKKSKRRKLDLLELARSEAEVIEIMRKFSDDKSDPEDELTCCKSRRAKEKKYLDEFGESSEEEGYKISKDEIMMSKAQRIAKWLVSVVAAVDFFISAQDSFWILLRKMQIEYLFMAQIYNCEDLIGNGDNWLIWANCIHALVSVGLLFMEDRSTAAFGIYWLISQSLRTFLMIFEAFFRSRFKSKFLFIFLSFLWWRVPLDLIQMGIVLFRYYKLNNPFPQRLKALATEIHLDRPLNNELRLRDSTFLQSKFRLREAAAFQTLEIIRKVKKVGKQSKMRNRFSIIRTEIIKALNVLKNPKRYPMKQTRADTKVKEERIDNDDNITILPTKSTATTIHGSVVPSRARMKFGGGQKVQFPAKVPTEQAEPK